MIACSIALAMWTGGLSFLTHRDDKQRAAMKENEASTTEGTMERVPEDAK